MRYRPKQRNINRRISKAEKDLKKCSTSLAIREMQIKITLRFHHIPVRMAKMKSTSDNSCY